MEEDPVMGVADVGWVRADHHRVSGSVVSHLLKTSPDLRNKVILFSLCIVLIEHET